MEPRGSVLSTSPNATPCLFRAAGQESCGVGAFSIGSGILRANCHERSHLATRILTEFLKYARLRNDQANRIALCPNPRRQGHRRSPRHLPRAPRHLRRGLRVAESSTAGACRAGLRYGPRGLRVLSDAVQQSSRGGALAPRHFENLRRPCAVGPAAHGVADGQPVSTPRGVEFASRRHHHPRTAAALAARLAPGRISARRCQDARVVRRNGKGRRRATCSRRENDGDRKDVFSSGDYGQHGSGCDGARRLSLKSEAERGKGPTSWRIVHIGSAPLDVPPR